MTWILALTVVALALVMLAQTFDRRVSGDEWDERGRMIAKLQRRLSKARKDRRVLTRALDASESHNQELRTALRASYAGAAVGGGAGGGSGQTLPYRGETQCGGGAVGAQQTTEHRGAGSAARS